MIFCAGDNSRCVRRPFSTTVVLTAQHKHHGFRSTCEKVWIVHTLHFQFLWYSLVKRHLDNDSCLPIYTMIPAICDTPRQTQGVRNSFFPNFVMVITVLWAKWFVVVCRYTFRKLLWHRNHSSDNITRRPGNRSTSFLFVVVFWMPRVLRYIDMVPTVCLTSTGNPAPGKQEFCLAPSETMIEQGEKVPIRA